MSAPDDYVCPGCGARRVLPNRAARRRFHRNGEHVPPGTNTITHAEGCRQQATAFRVHTRIKFPSVSDRG